MKDNAKQYLAFDALSGFGSLLRQREKRIVERKNVAFCSEWELKERLVGLKPGARAAVVYSWEGELVRVSGTVAWISYGMERLRIGRTELSFADIVSITRAGG